MSIRVFVLACFKFELSKHIRIGFKIKNEERVISGSEGFKNRSKLTFDKEMHNKNIFFCTLAVSARAYKPYRHSPGTPSIGGRQFLSV